jgi:hypothetical protein
MGLGGLMLPVGIDILPPAKARGFLIAQEWDCIATAHWFLLLTALLHRSLHRLAPSARRLFYFLKRLFRLHTVCLVFASCDFEAF